MALQTTSAPPPLSDELKKNQEQARAYKKPEAMSVSMVIDLSLGKESTTLAQKLTRRLAALRRHYYTVLLVEGLSWLAATLFLLALLQMSADYFFDIPWFARLGFSLMDLLVLGVVAYQKIYLPFSHHITIDRAAVKVEQKWPILKSSLISSVQLSRVSGAFPGGSQELIRRLLVQTTEQVKALNFKEVVSLKARNRAMLALICVLLVAGASFYMSGSLGVALLKRWALFNIPLPSKTQVFPVTKNIYAAIGTDVTVSARAGGIIPAKGKIRIIDEKGSRREFLVTPEKGRTDLFPSDIRNLQEKLTYQFFLGDGKGEVYNIYAEPPPVISKISCEVEYPGYTGMGTRKMDADNLSILAGSKLKIAIVASAPLRSAKIITESEKTETKMNLGGSAQANVEIRIPEKGLGGFSIPLINTDGIASAQNVVYRIDVIPDQPPVVKMLSPKAEKETITLNYRPELIYEAKDDFALEGVLLWYQIDQVSATGEAKSSSSPQGGWITKPEKGLPAKYDWDLKGLNLHEGDIVNYWLEARDQNNVTGPGSTLTPQQQFVVVSPAEKRKELLDRIQENAEKLGELAKKQTNVQGSVGQAIKERTP